MHNKQKRGWIKHLDFIVIDILCLQLCFVLSYWIWQGFSNPYEIYLYRYQAILLMFCQLIVALFTDSYKNIIRRSRFQEFASLIRFEVSFMLLDLLFLFLVHQIYLISRKFTGIFVIMYLIVSFVARLANKKRIYANRGKDTGKKSLMIITSGELAEEVINKLTDVSFDFKITGLVLLDVDEADNNICGIPTMGCREDILIRIGREWVDEVLIYQPENIAYPSELVDSLLLMGITVHYGLSALNEHKECMQEVSKVGTYKVLTNSLKIVSYEQVIIKRMMDILGGLVGCFLTCIIFIFVAPAIFIKSPGPIFFKQLRVGQNGRQFYMYKFRSMYMDAEERKKQLMEQNKIADGMMFKMDDDPRIIGSEKKDKNGKPKGIGNFIRRTSLDEFPQFWNVLKGDMSLVGTRPPTLDEWYKYDLHHRVRMSIKPGITGLWQISGRSDITDFEKVVALDRKYIQNWSVEEDIKILLKTVSVVLNHEGAE